MNFLAHALLAGDDPALVVGGVIGDWIKGPLPGRLPPDLARGVALHRAIDSHAETHPAFRRSRARVSPARRRYAGVLVDIFYDHLLACDWAALHHRPFADYCHAVYGAVAARFAELPEDSHYALKLMATEDWFLGYTQVDGMADVLARMARRARRPNPLAGGEAEFLADVEGFRSDFERWLAESRVFAADWRAANALPWRDD